MTASDLEIRECHECNEAFKRDLVLVRGKSGNRVAYILLPGKFWKRAAQLAAPLLLAEFEAGRTTEFVPGDISPIVFDRVPVFVPAALPQ